MVNKHLLRVLEIVWLTSKFAPVLEPERTWEAGNRYCYRWINILGIKNAQWGRLRIRQH